MSKSYRFRLESQSSLIMHADNVEQADMLTAWRKSVANKSVSTPGDDRSPPWTWQTYCMHDGKVLAISHEVIMASLRDAGSKISLKGKQTLKRLSQSAIFVEQEYSPLLVRGKSVHVKDLVAMRDLSFAEQKKAVEVLGFELFVKRATVGTSRHVRVRPRFPVWALEGTLLVSDPVITRDVLAGLLETAGRLAGIGDWRPSSPKSPGPYGMFSARIL